MTTLESYKLGKQNQSTREKLLRQAAKALKEGRNVVVIGPFGIGKTHYCRSVAKAMGVRPLRISVLNDSRDMAIEILKTWCAFELERGLPKKRKTELFRLRRALNATAIPQLKSQIRTIGNKSDYLVIVDDVLKVPRQKLLFIGFLAECGFRIIAAVEAQCEESTLMGLRVKCRSTVRIFLPRLTTKESQELILSLSQSFGVSFSESDIAWFATMYRGYPLMIVEGMKRQLARG